jgi:predicted RNA-binding Zn-ribbon protein involved in translation (DUF1610 family)
VPTYKPVETMDDLSLICSSQHINKRGREKIAKEMDHIFTNEMICPYCGEEQTDPCEEEDDSGEYECEGCGKIFRYNRHTTIEYCSMKMEEEDDSDECEHAECRTKFRYDRRTIIEYSTMKIQY